MDRVSVPSVLGQRRSFVVGRWGPPRAAVLPKAQGGADGPVDQGATSSTCVVYGGWAAGQAATSGVCLWSAGATSSGAGLRGLWAWETAPERVALRGRFKA